MSYYLYIDAEALSEGSCLVGLTQLLPTGKRQNVFLFREDTLDFVQEVQVGDGKGLALLGLIDISDNPLKVDIEKLCEQALVAGLRLALKDQVAAERLLQAIGGRYEDIEVEVAKDDSVPQPS